MRGESGNCARDGPCRKQLNLPVLVDNPSPPSAAATCDPLVRQAERPPRLLTRHGSFIGVARYRNAPQLDAGNRKIRIPMRGDNRCFISTTHPPEKRSMSRLENSSN